MFRLDEVGNYKKILIKGELALPPHPYKSMFCRCFSRFCRGEAGKGCLETSIILIIRSNSYRNLLASPAMRAHCELAIGSSWALVRRGLAIGSSWALVRRELAIGFVIDG